jgi:mycoredoxin-dependent peroxiredoxin
MAGDVPARGVPGVGDAAPDFELRDQHGQAVRLSSYRGRPVVLMFYPFAFSRVCTGELRSVRDDHPELAGGAAQLLAISCDPMFSLREFADRESLGFPLLSDFWPHGEVASTYGVLDRERGCATRSTFVVDADGVVRWSVHNAMPDARDLQEQARVLAGLTG